jgi:hypothetical protein
VTTGKRRRDLIEITSGVNAGDVILWQADKGRIARIDAVPRPFEPPAPTGISDAGKPRSDAGVSPSATTNPEDTGAAESTGGP